MSIIENMTYPKPSYKEFTSSKPSVNILSKIYEKSLAHIRPADNFIDMSLSEDLDSPLEIRFELKSIRSKGWQITKPIPVVVETLEDGSVLMSDDIFNQYGEGTSLDDAREDFEKTLVEYYAVLESHVKESHPETLATLNFLKQYLKRL